MSTPILRLAHVSDLHLIDPKTRLRLRDWLGKRAIGWANQQLGRGRLFRHAPVITRHLVEMLPTRGLDGVLFSGDATTLGTHREFILTDEILGPLIRSMPGLAVPGNHDHYVKHGVLKRFFEDLFEPWQAGERTDQHKYPFARQFKGIWFICVNSAQANLAPWDSRGRVGHAQLDRLAALLARLPVGPKVLLTHYPYQLGNGQPELRWRKLRDVHQLWDVVQKDVVLWLHGHRHVRYHLTIPGSHCTEICVGSSTQEGRWSYHEYDFHPGHLVIRHRMWNKDTQRFEDHAEETVAGMKFQA